tara:strand:+ start:499 stop:669 length:171 start_codon:yes stop_codon:yes gene_type:complete
MNKEEEREEEKDHYSSELFWQNKEKQLIIEQLLQKIYDIQDELEVIKNNDILRDNS